MTAIRDEEHKLFIDAKGMVCPYPLIMVRRKLKEIDIGAVIEIEVDYEHAAIVSIPEWCRKNDMPCEMVQLEDRLWRVYVKKAIQDK